MVTCPDTDTVGRIVLAPPSNRRTEVRKTSENCPTLGNRLNMHFLYRIRAGIPVEDIGHTLFRSREGPSDTRAVGLRDVGLSSSYFMTDTTSSSVFIGAIFRSRG